MPPRAGVEILRDRSRLEGLLDQWSALPQAQEQLTLCADWILAAANHLHGADSLRIMLLRGIEAVSAAAPLAAHSGLIDRHELIGASDLYEPAGLLYTDERALAALCRGLTAAGRPILLQRVPADTPLVPAFKAAARRRGILFEFAASSSPFVAIASDWDTYKKGLSGRRRQDYRRARRGLERLGEVTVDIRHATAESVEEELAEVVEVEAAGWKSRRGSALLHNDGLRSFFTELAGRLARRGLLRLCFLRLDGTPIAMQIDAEYARRWWVLKIGYDERWARHSPGIQLMWDVLRHAHERELRSFEFLGTAESWLSIWGGRRREFRTLAFYPYNVRGAIALSADVGSRSLRRALALRPGQR